MADNTKIEWADATANFWIGCTKLSPACDHCYAERDWDHRRHRVTWGPHGDRSYVKAGAQVVRKMQRGAKAFMEKHGRKPRIFVNSLSDFADNHKSIKPEWREEVWQLARECPDVILMILTKRPQNLPNYLPQDWGDGYLNVWIGTTVEDQTRADQRIPDLLATPAAVRFLSCEPLLEWIDLGHICLVPQRPGSFRAGIHINALQGRYVESGLPYIGEWDVSGPLPPNAPVLALDWVICGGESGPGARGSTDEVEGLMRDLLGQCQAAGVPFFGKQNFKKLPLPEDLMVREFPA